MKTELPGYTLRYRVVGFGFPTVDANLDHMTLIGTASLGVVVADLAIPPWVWGVVFIYDLGVLFSLSSDFIVFL